MDHGAPPDLPYDPRRDGDRRAPEPAAYTLDQLLGRAPIRLRRRSDKVRLAAHVVGALALVALTAWWVLLPHAFAGRVLLTLTPDRGVHVGDLPSLLFLAAAVRSAVVVGSTLRLAATGRHGLAAAER